MDFYYPTLLLKAADCTITERERKLYAHRFFLSYYVEYMETNE